MMLFVFRIINGPSLESAGELAAMIGKKYIGKLAEYVVLTEKDDESALVPFSSWTLVSLPTASNEPETVISLLNTSNGFISCYLDDVDVMAAT